MGISLEKLRSADDETLFEFEVKNRKYFERMVPSRGGDYYTFETFKLRHHLLLEEQAKGESYYYLIKDHSGLILGRINVVDIDKERKLGYIGYRVGEEYAGKRIAKKALKILIELLADKGVEYLLAKTTNNNTASQKVLEKNGFTYISTSEEEVEMNGHSLKFVYYRKDL
ncbi:GNAT family N-acetyltransferase [Alkalihalophilus marmarensis]|uniref:GNAT family N-acetyltransferase n=1 Tax=Alkalihalophilus marmarensis TaxID=521377 RepID=UPI002DBDD9CF|nr:GNAT family N-acetyltransferase [Alkalihalophilus marmarensis]MEC2074044.1 GNAT family N-acetyltransferase [Alkalihalophilus marmarensis]